MATEVFLFGDFHPLPVDAGPYTLLERIGAGGMAEVFLAELRGPAGFAKKLVLKRLLPEHKGVPALEKMFLREAKLAALLNHPGLMQTYELADIEGEMFMVMEHVAGLDLSRLARAATAAGTRVPFDVLAGALADVALGLHHMHSLTDEAGVASTVIHRDVSPDNIVLAHTGAAKLVDFGIAKSVRAEQLTTVGELKGKLRFMPPEQLRGQKLGPPADLFSLGVTLYRLLTGKHPFDGRGQLDVVEKILGRQPRPPRSWDAAIPADLDALALALLEKDAQRRPTADDVYGRLVAHWPRDLRASGAFVARMMPVKASQPIGGEAVEEATRELDDDSQVPTGTEASAYREILSMRDDAVVAVAPEGTRIVTVAVRSDVHDRDTRVVSVTETRTAQQPAPTRRAAPRTASLRPAPRASAPPAAPSSSRLRIAALAGAVAVGGVTALAFFVAREGPPDARASAPLESAPATRAPVASAPVPVLPVESAPLAAVPVEIAPVPPMPVEHAPVAVARAPVAPEGRPAKARAVRVQLRAPPSVEWRAPGGGSLAKGAALATVSADARELVAVDARTGGRVRVPIVDGVADFADVERGTLHVLVFPFGTVSIGPKVIGDSPVAPVQLPVGRYKVRVTGDGAPVERDVEVTPGTQTVKVRLE